ncbi:ABC transporter permease [[Clostridium] sordellii]|nr:ABC transporter permease [[Clostridium] sordellii] [Paeniclostridium sordellii]
MVITMNINSICKKLAIKNIRNYMILIFCIVFGTLFHTSYGLLIFSPTITNVIVAGGTTSSILYGFYTALGLATLCFISYAFGLFLKQKSKDLGVFISLGITSSNARKILSNELKYIILISVLVGLLLSLPTVYILWGSIEKVFSSGELKYIIGWNGFIGGIIFSGLIFLTINLKLRRFFKKTNLVSMLKKKEEVEVVKDGSFIKVIVGILATIIGIYLWDRSRRGLIFDGLPFMSMVLVFTSVMGIFITISQIPFLGKFVKRFSKSKYHKNIVFFNLLKLRGSQYRNALFSITILTSVAMFIISWSLVDPLASNEIADLEYSFDYSIRKNINQNTNINESDIYDLAKKSNENISGYVEMESIDVYTNREFGSETARALLKCISESDYNRVYKDNVDVQKGNYILYASNEEKILNKSPNLEVYTLKDDKKFSIKKQDAIHKVIVSGILEFYVLDDDDFTKFKNSTPAEYVNTFLQFNVENWETSNVFFENLRDLMHTTNENGLEIITGFSGNDYRDETTEFFDYEDVSSNDYRWWEYKPIAKIYSAQYIAREMAIYSLMYMYIAILAVAIISLVTYMKVINIYHQDTDVYKKMSILGSTKRNTQKIITNQLIVIFSIPTLIGVTVGSLIAIYMKASTLSVGVAIKYTIILALVYIFIQLLILLLTRISIVKNLKIDNLTDYES